MQQLIAMWNDDIFDKDCETIKKELGGTINQKIVDNCCAIRMTHALRQVQIKVDIPQGDYKDKNGNPYFIKVASIKKWLDKNFQPTPLKINGNLKLDLKIDFKIDFFKNDKTTLEGIIVFEECGYTNATGHVTLLDANLNIRDTARDPNENFKDYFNKSKQVTLYQMKVK